MVAALSDLRVVDVVPCIAPPLGDMTLAHLGAEVIRVDPIGDDIDHVMKYPSSRILCDAHILSIFEDAAEVQAEVIGQELLGRMH